MVHTEQMEKNKVKNKKIGKRHKKLGGENPSKKGEKKKNMREKLRHGRHDVSKGDHSQKPSRILHKNTEAQKSSKHQDQSKQQASILRKRVDPETAKYFTEITNLFESKAVDLEERSTVCGNALEETRGKELELATDAIISRTLQGLLEGCDVDQLCGFLWNCAEVFPSIAADRFGSHVAETALKSLGMHLQHEESHAIIEDTLSKISKVVVVDSVNLMCSCYGSHVFRSLLCLCKGVPLDSLGEFHVTKPSAVLAERLNSKLPQTTGNNSKSFQPGFPVVYSYLLREMLNHAKQGIATLRINKFSSLVLQTALKLSMGDDQVLLHAISILLGCEQNDFTQGKVNVALVKKDVMNLLDDTASSHLLEVIIEVAPEALYTDFLNEVFKGSLFDISSHHCGNFVVQALISSARESQQVDLIWEELGPKLKKLLEYGKSGVVASLLASCQRLQTRNNECCEAVARAVCSESEYPNCTVPHLLFLERYIRENSCWAWPVGDKMHTLGCLMLQTIFKFSKHVIRPYITSITCMEADQMFHTAQDAGGSRVLEAFLCSDVPTKQKHKVVAKLQDHYGELSMHPSSAFTVEKCFTAGDVPLKEAIAKELLAVQAELSKKKHGPYLLKKLDINGFAARPEQWRKSQVSKEAIYREFKATFGLNTKSQEQKGDSSQHSEKDSMRRDKRHKKTNKDEASNASPSFHSELSFPGLDISMSKLGFPHEKKGSKRTRSSYATTKKFDDGRFIQNTQSSSLLKRSGKRKSSMTELADLAAKSELTQAEIHELFKPAIKKEKEQFGDKNMPLFKKQRM